jgi:hypothetical protein
VKTLQTAVDTAGDHIVLLDRDGNVIASQAATIKTRGHGNTLELTIELPVTLTSPSPSHIDAVELRGPNGQRYLRMTLNSHLAMDDSVTAHPSW